MTPHAIKSTKTSMRAVLGFLVIGLTASPILASPDSEERSDGESVRYPESARTVTSAGSLMLSRQITNRLAPVLTSDSRTPGQAGVAAGEASDGVSFWLTGSAIRLRNTLSTTELDGPLVSGLAGADIQITDEILVGLSTSYEHADVDTPFNDGSFTSSGFLVTPYLGLGTGLDLLGLGTGSLTFDLLFSYGRFGVDTERDEATGTVTGDFDADRYLVSGNVTYVQPLGEWDIAGQIGYLWARQANDAFTESDGTQNGGVSTTLGEGRVGTRVTRYLGNGFDAYAGLAYVRDFVFNNTATPTGLKAADNDPDEWEATAALEWAPTETLFGGIEVRHGFFRSNTQNTTLTGYLRLSF